AARAGSRREGSRDSWLVSLPSYRSVAGGGSSCRCIAARALREHEVFDVSFGPWDAAGSVFMDDQPRPLDLVEDLAHGAGSELFVADYAASFLRFFAADLKLRFDEREEEAARAKDRKQRRKQLLESDERSVDDREIDAAADRLRRERASIGALEHHHALVGAQLGSELTVSDVHRIHARRARLQEAVCETAG